KSKELSLKKVKLLLLLAVADPVIAGGGGGEVTFLKSWGPFFFVRFSPKGIFYFNFFILGHLKPTLVQFQIIGSFARKNTKRIDIILAGGGCIHHLPWICH